MKYDKDPLTFDEQAELLLRRGMRGDKGLIVRRLQSVSFFRLSGYWYTFRQDNKTDPHSPLSEFKPGTTFEAVWERYAFDRRLRLLMMDAVERIEIVVRSLLATHHAMRHGLFSYAETPAALPSRDSFVDKCGEEQRRSKDAFVRHFVRKYSDRHAFLPIWMAAEIMSFGTLLTLHRGSHQSIRREIAAPFEVHATVFASWLLMLNTIRNICAHHGRLWNRELGTRPQIPERLPDWQTPIAITGNRVFVALTICRWCLARIAPQSGWHERLHALLRSSPTIPLNSMGFPESWESSPIWTGSHA